MSDWMQWVAVSGLIVISALTRSAFFITEQIWTMPKWLESGLRYAPIGALAAVAVPAVVMSRGVVATSPVMVMVSLLMVSLLV